MEPAPLDHVGQVERMMKPMYWSFAEVGGEYIPNQSSFDGESISFQAIVTLSPEYFRVEGLASKLGAAAPTECLCTKDSHARHT